MKGVSKDCLSGVLTECHNVDMNTFEKFKNKTQKLGLLPRADHSGDQRGRNEAPGYTENECH